MEKILCCKSSGMVMSICPELVVEGQEYRSDGVYYRVEDISLLELIEVDVIPERVVDGFAVTLFSYNGSEFVYTTDHPNYGVEGRGVYDPYETLSL